MTENCLSLECVKNASTACLNKEPKKRLFLIKEKGWVDMRNLNETKQTYSTKFIDYSNISKNTSTMNIWENKSKVNNTITNVWVNGVAK